MANIADMDPVAFIEDNLGGHFVKVSCGHQVFQLPGMDEARRAIKELGAEPFNWCPVQQPNGPRDHKPTVFVPRD